MRRKAALAETTEKQRILSLFLCLLTCFSGGVFLATCFLHLLPELSEHLAHMKEEYHYTWNYPVAELLSCIGFFSLFFFEESVLLLMPSIGHSHMHSAAAITASSVDEK